MTSRQAFLNRAAHSVMVVAFVGMLPACAAESPTGSQDDHAADGDSQGSASGTNGSRDGGTTTAGKGDGGKTTSSGTTQPGSSGNSGTAGKGDGGSAASGSSSSGGGKDDSNGAPDDATPAGPRVDNPYEGATGYVNPEWQTKAEAEPGGERIAKTPTAVWLDRTAAIAGTANSGSNGSMGLADHLDAALAQKAGYVQFVIYNLPGRDCSALASNGELGPDDLPKYKSDYIDPIAAIMKRPKYSSLRIINIIEVDSLPNLVTNQNLDTCAKVKANGAYVDGVTYALKTLGAIGNVYNYVDAGHHGWLGWDSNLGPSADLFAQVGKAAGFATVTGFSTNTANYSALKEPYFSADSKVSGKAVSESKWVDHNPFVDEQSYALALRTKLIAGGFDEKIGMLIDTSRNGWGGSKRPSAASSATDVDMFVDQSRVDRRIHAGNWCNQSGAGLGERPTANPASGIDAYVWIKPPGESDGASMQIDNQDGKGFDRMCDPSYGGNERNGNSATGALASAPLSGTWFSAQFQELMKNAFPAL